MSRNHLIAGMMIVIGLYGGILLALGLVDAVSTWHHARSSRRRVARGIRAAMWRPK